MLLEQALSGQGTATMAVSGGSTPALWFRELVDLDLDWSRIHLFWVDERAVPPTHERSNYAGAKAAFLDPSGIPSSNIHRMRAEASDLAIAAMDYEAELRDSVRLKLGGVPALDLVVLGIGDDGHTASLFPGDATLFVTDKLVAPVPAAGQREARLTLTSPVLESARATVVIVLGASKHPALERVWAASGDLRETPARVIRGCRGSVTWVIDRAAGGMG